MEFKAIQKVEETNGIQDATLTSVAVDHRKDRRVKALQTYVEGLEADRLYIKICASLQAKKHVVYLKRALKRKKAERVLLKTEVKKLQSSNRAEKFKYDLYDQLLSEIGEEGMKKFLKPMRSKGEDQVTMDAYEDVENRLGEILESLDAIKK